MAQHSFATLALDSGTDIFTASELPGCVSVATIYAYVQANPERMMAAVEANPLAQIERQDANWSPSDSSAESESAATERTA